MPRLTVEERLGTVVGRKVRLERVLGEGGMGVVCEATHVTTGRKVAVKLLHPELLRVGVVVERFLDEARAAAAIRHPNVVEVLDLDTTDDGVPFIVMELLHGETLRARLDREGPFSPDDAWDTLGPAMGAIAAAHEAGVVHRDIKPDNLFFHARGDGSDILKVLDFGIAKLGSIKRTATGTQLGTAHYMSPEQARGQDVGPWSDVWAMGVVWFEVLTGRLPFDFPPGATEASVLAQVISSSPARLGDVRSVPADLAAVIDRALRPSRAQRFADMAAFAEALEPCFGERVELPGTRERRRVPKTVPMDGPPSAGVALQPGRKSGCGGVVLAVGVVLFVVLAFVVMAAGVTCVGCLAVLGSTPDVRASCTLSRCTFRNQGGGEGSRCVAVMVRADDGTQWTSEAVCSGVVPPGGEVAQPVAFDRSPLRSCTLSHCELVVATPASRDETVRFQDACRVLDWPDELASEVGVTQRDEVYTVLHRRRDGWRHIRRRDMEGWTRCVPE